MGKIFLYRLKNSDDRDCCAYIDDSPLRFECGHYFGSPRIEGSCYCNSEYAEYGEIETHLSEEEYTRLITFKNAINDLGYGITIGDEQYQKGIALCNGVQDIYDKLNSQEALAFFMEIQKGEKEWLKKTYNLSEAEMDEIWDVYMLDYKDRSIVSRIWDDIDEASMDEAYDYGFIDDNNELTEWGTFNKERYFDFKAFGEDLLEENEYLELSSGKVVRFSY